MSLPEFKIETAKREHSKLRVGFFGPSGSGKTMSALRFAKGLTGDYGKVVVLDTEQGSAQLYANLGPFKCCSLSKPFYPGRYVEAIKYLEAQQDIEVIIIDSISHEWEGEGGCLDIHTRAGGRFQDWSKVTPLHNRFINSIIECSKHVIVTGRTKSDYAIDTDGKKTSVSKVGLKSVMRDGFEYELTMSFRLNQDHYAIADKDRTDIFKDESYFLIDETIGERVALWNKGV